MKSLTKLVALLAALVVTAAAAQKFPERPIRMIVPLPPGSASDFLSRTLGVPLTELYGQQVVVENRPGAGGLIGRSILSKATPWSRRRIPSPRCCRKIRPTIRFAISRWSPKSPRYRIFLR